MTPTQQRIAEIKERLIGTTNGEWEYLESSGMIDKPCVQLFTRGSSDDSRDVSHEQCEANGYFIAHARQDVPWLISQLEAAQAKQGECAWVENDTSQWITWCNNAHEFTTGNPRDNHHYFCPYCGREIRIHGK